LVNIISRPFDKQDL